MEAEGWLREARGSLQEAGGSLRGAGTALPDPPGDGRAASAWSSRIRSASAVSAGSGAPAGGWLAGNSGPTAGRRGAEWREGRSGGAGRDSSG